MNKIYWQKCVLGGMFLLTPCLFFSCSDKLEDNDHYKVPSWLKGNAYEVLQKEGNYSIFLHGIDLTGNDGVVAGKSIVTVAAPDDEAFGKYLTEKGYSSIDEMYQANPQFVKNLIGMHLMYYAFDWDKMVNFRPNDGDAATEADKKLNAGLFYKHRTHSQDAIEQVSATIDGTTKDISVYHYERYLPVFSTKYFETKGIADAAADYHYFYPNTQWYGEAHAGDGFNIANAAVNDENNVITDNGYLYHVDQVIEPVNTIYDELKNNADYSEFFNLYNSYETYTEALKETNQTLGYTAYLRSHGSLPNIAYEWTFAGSDKAYMQTYYLESQGYSIFAPTNQALTQFFKTFWTPEQGYGNINSLDPLIKRYFVMQMFADSKFPVMPTEIKEGKVKTVFGTTVNFDPANIHQSRRKVCTNGFLYGMDEMTAPAIFSSVVAPAFKDVNYNCYLYTLDGSGLTSSFAADNSQFVSLIPSNAQFETADPQMRLYTTISGKELQEYSSDAGAFVQMGDNAKLNLVNIHISDQVKELKTEGLQVVDTYAPFNYWFVKDGKITNNANFNQLLNPSNTEDPFVAFHEITNAGNSWSNGKAYAYDAKSIFKRQSGDGVKHALAVCNDANFEYYLFAQLLNKAGLVSGTTLVFPSDDAYVTDGRQIVFVPTNEAISKNYQKVPGYKKLFDANGNYKATAKLTATEKAQLQAWVTDYFVSSEENVFTDYPFLGSSCKGQFITKSLTTKLEIIDGGSSLSVKLVGSDEVVPVDSKYSYFPFAFNDGCIHFIDGLLK